MKKILIVIGFIALSFFLFTPKKRALSVQHEPDNSEQQDQSDSQPIQPKVHHLKAPVVQMKSPQVRKPQQLKRQQQPQAQAYPDRARPSVASSGAQYPKPVLKHETNVRQNANVEMKSKQYDEADINLLKRAYLKARGQGSKIAYIGRVNELYAFDPNFFEVHLDQTGRKVYQVRQVETYQNVRTPDGQSEMLVQREPYPMPINNEIDYQLLNRAVIRATDDGAILINVAAVGVNRSYLENSIQYARRQGVVVVTVPPPALEQ